jgi:hypothetical protein
MSSRTLEGRAQRATCPAIPLGSLIMPVLGQAHVDEECVGESRHIRR